MSSTDDLHRQLLNPALSTDERARIYCQLVKQLQENEDYEAALEVMDKMWPDVVEPGKLEQLEEPTRAEVLLRVGALTRWVGSTMRIEGAQDTAKDLVSDSIRIFKSLKDTRKVAEGETELGYCYFHEGQFDDARVMFTKARTLLNDQDFDLKAAAILRSVILDKQTNRLNEALSILVQSASLFENSESDVIKGLFHQQFGNVLSELFAQDNRSDYLDRAHSEYSLASRHFAQAGLTSDEANVQKNLAKLCVKANKLNEARDYLDRAESLLTLPEDNPILAEIKDIWARVLLAEGAFAEAEKMASAAVEMLEKEYEQSLPEHLRASNAFAVDSSEFLEDDYDLASDRFSPLEYAQRYLGDWSNLSLDEILHRYESHRIRMTLEGTGGVLSETAYLLGLRRHQLRYMIKKHHQNLRPLITRTDEAATLPAEAIRILHADKDSTTAAIVQEIVQQEGWELKRRCTSGKAAFRRLMTSEGEYDLLLLDDELVGMSGMELIECVREFSRLRHIPIVMLSAAGDEAIARKAGADAFLRKPDDICLLVKTITLIFDLDQAP